jgi:hypothetical protein
MTAIIAWIFIASSWGFLGYQYSHTHLETVYVCEHGDCVEKQQRVRD